jgi:lysine biosynthesis protein LysW
MSIAKSVTTICLECEDPIELDVEPRQGQIIICPVCDSEMEIIGVHPLRLEFFYEGDWDDEDLDDDEDKWDD